MCVEYDEESGSSEVGRLTSYEPRERGRGLSFQKALGSFNEKRCDPV